MLACLHVQAHTCRVAIAKILDQGLGITVEEPHFSTKVQAEGL